MPRCRHLVGKLNLNANTRGGSIMNTWQVERWAGLCRLAVEETDKIKFWRELRASYDAMTERLQQNLRKLTKEELDAMKSALKALKRRRKAFELTK
jgi:hypothetical protein